MCGIVGYVGNKNCLHTLINGLKKLEYRGYDSSGIAYFLNGKIKITKTVGRIKDLEGKIEFSDDSQIGIGHTRWATHGGATSINAHPHKQGNITIVHNGIIENYLELKELLIQNQYHFASDTDTEIACAYIDYLYQKSHDMLSSIQKCCHDFIGSFAMAIMTLDEQDKIYVLKKDSPLILGIGEGENFIASSVNAFDGGVKNYIILEDEDYGFIDSNEVVIHHQGKKVERKLNVLDRVEDVADKKGYAHYMLKEIHEQSEIIEKLNKKYLNHLDKLIDFSKFDEIHIIGCGSAYHAGIVGKYIIEENSNIHVQVYIASEYRYQHIHYRDNTLVIAISQSGETADTIACIKKAYENKVYTLGIVNVYNSSIARMVDEVIYTEAGAEIAVATTKGYLTQVYILTLLVLKLMEDKKKLIEEYYKLPMIIEKLASLDYHDMGYSLSLEKDIFYLGRNIDYASMLEGTLKLKEISYIHAECYAAGELKHGTISLIEEGTCVVGLITKDNIAPKTVSNIKEVKARGAYVVLIVKQGLEEMIDRDCYDEMLVIEQVHEILQPIVNAIPLQLIAYSVAKEKNCDIDKPRNLAKSVTVE